MAEDWTGIAAEVAAALTEVGFPATLLRPGVTVGPQWDPTPMPPTEHTLSVMQDTLGLGLIDGSNTRAGDVRVVMAADGTIPTTADRLRLGSTVYTIERAEPFAPAGVALYIEMLLRA